MYIHNTQTSVLKKIVLKIYTYIIFDDETYFACQLFLHSLIFVPQSKDKMSVEMKFYLFTH